MNAMARLLSRRKLGKSNAHHSRAAYGRPGQAEVRDCAPHKSLGKLQHMYFISWDNAMDDMG